MPIREYRCGQNHVTEEIHSLGREPIRVACSHCGDLAEKIVSLPSFKLFGGTQEYDVKDVWEGTPLEGAGEPSLDAQEAHVAKPFVDRGRKTQIGGGNRAAGRQWKQAQQAFQEAIERPNA